MKTRLMFFWFIITFLLPGVGAAGVKQEIKFSSGESSALIKNSVVRGERDQYFLTAKAGQKMEISITAVEANAAFTIYQPGYEVSQDDYGLLKIKGDALLGAGETDAATAWEGVLPIFGKYLILVGPTRGNTTYKLKISIH
jgi:hypothetical protein